MTAAPDAPAPVYQPFPTFVEWHRTTAVGTEVFDRFAALFDAAKESADPRAVAALVARSTRWAAIDTGAIEGLYDTDRGFTVSVATSAAMLETIGREKGPAVERSVRDALAAYELVLDLATRREVVTEAGVRELHAVMCASQETYTVYTDLGPQQHALPKGAYKTVPNSPLNLKTGRVHRYAPVDDTPAEMARLVGELRSDAFAAAHPVLKALYAHYAFVCVHPFADGNGRVARALAAIYTYRAPGVPLVVFVDQEPGYLDALEAADAGEPDPFVSFVTERLIDTMQAVRDELSDGPAPPPLNEQMASLQQALVGRSGLLHDEVDALAARLATAWREVVTEVVAGADFHAPLSAAVTGGFETLRAPDGYCDPVTTHAERTAVVVTSASPATAQVRRTYGVAAARSLDQSRADYVIYDDGGRVRLEVFIRELRLEVGTSLRNRLRGLAERDLARLVQVTAQSAETRLRETGYID